MRLNAARKLAEISRTIPIIHSCNAALSGLGENYAARLASMPEEGYPCHLVLKVPSWLGSYPEPSGFVDLSSYIEKRSSARPILLTNLTNLTKMQFELTNAI